MNEQVYKSAISRYIKWAKGNQEQVAKDIQERKEMSEHIQAYDKKKLSEIDAAGLIDLLSSLWTMGMWGNKQNHIESIIASNGLETLQKQFTNLLYGDASIETRWDEFRSKVKGIGPAVMSELLNKMYPEKYILWNNKAKTSFLKLEIPKTPKYYASLDGKMYAYLSDTGRKLIDKAKDLKSEEITDLLSFDYFIWQELQDDIPAEDNTVQEEPKTTKKQSKFIHNDVRDRIMDIGTFLGFKASTEEKVADGAVVDAVWEASIGNMGRVIYVFQVQTSGSIDSLILNLMKAKSNKAVQGIIAVSDIEQIEKIKKEVTSLPQIKDAIKYWDYRDVLNVYDQLSSAFESINKLELVPEGFTK